MARRLSNLRWWARKLAATCSALEPEDENPIEFSLSRREGRTTDDTQSDRCWAWKDGHSVYDDCAAQAGLWALPPHANVYRFEAAIEMVSRGRSRQAYGLEGRL